MNHYAMNALRDFRLRIGDAVRVADKGGLTVDDVIHELQRITQQLEDDKDNGQ